MEFSSQTRAVITGGGQGIGRAMCLELAKVKAKILVADIKKDKAEEVAQLVNEQGGEAKAVECDVASSEAVESLAIEADKSWGGTDLLVNNAGVPVSGAIGEISLEDWRWIVDINLLGGNLGLPLFCSAG